MKRFRTAKMIKMIKMKEAQLDLAEIQLDAELSQAKKDYQKYHGEKE